ncbi:amidase [Devosia pacifica]|uniref:Indoleacetamide hydrolase n=1 Tax=Devosia pacifica TaxID=1335967 RepID=A0A918SD77_9HYPH|nr:amidase [Devosia pacifica]GHA32795.1 amidase [Devosia pacifica]
MSLADLSIAEAGEGLRARTFSSVELLSAHLERIAARDSALQAFVTLTEDRARAEAERADDELARGEDRGPLHGIPYALKDLIDTAGIRTTGGSKLHLERVPQRDADVAGSLADGGAVLLGKLMTYEFALVGPSTDLPFPAARNPFNRDHITGGSSSGSAAAVAGGLVRTAIGSDTGGSIRSPSAYSGCVGLKPGYERVPRRGVIPLSESLDCIGPLSASVKDAALTFDAIATPSDFDSAAAEIGRDIAGLRIGYARDWFIDDPALQPDMGVAMDAAASDLSILGARIEEIALPDYEAMEAAGAIILHAEALAYHLDDMRSRSADYGRQGFNSLAAGVAVTGDDVERAHRLGRKWRSEIDALFARYDAILTVTTLATAPAFSAFDGESPVWTPMRTLPFNLTGHPVLALPMGFANGLPMGLQLIGRHGGEARLCRIGAAYEAGTDHSAQKPVFAD